MIDGIVGFGVEVGMEGYEVVCMRFEADMALHGAVLCGRRGLGRLEVAHAVVKHCFLGPPALYHNVKLVVEVHG